MKVIKGILRILILSVAVICILNFNNIYDFLYSNFIDNGTTTEDLLQEVGVLHDKDTTGDSASGINILGLGTSEETWYDTATVQRVVDGDTLVVTLSDSDAEVRVRLIGVDTPESVHPDESQNIEEGVIASDYVKSFISPGMLLYLTYDEAPTDTYGRILAYVWLNPPSSPEPDDNECRTNMLQCTLIREGYAKPLAVTPNTKYAILFETIYSEVPPETQESSD